jgi:thymidylate synthase
MQNPTVITQSQFNSLDESSQTMIAKAWCAGQVEFEQVEPVTIWEEEEEEPETEEQKQERRRTYCLRVASYTRSQGQSVDRVASKEPVSYTHLTLPTID